MFNHDSTTKEYEMISNHTLDLIEERFNLGTLIEVPFDHEKTPRSLAGKKTKIETIFLLDETGARMTTLVFGETVSDALKLLGENAEEVAYVLCREEETLSKVLHG